MQIRTLLVALLVSTALPALASAQNLDDASRVSIFTGGGFGGEFDFTVHDAPIIGTTTASTDAAATPLVGARFESSLMRYVLLGAQFRSAFVRAADTSDSNNDRSALLDFDVTAKGRFPIHVKRFVLEPYVLLPFGFTLSVAKNGSSLDVTDSRTNPGWNIGGFGGLTFLTQGGFGAFFELGVMHHAVYDKIDTGGDNLRLSATLTQFTLQAGGTYAF